MDYLSQLLAADRAAEAVRTDALSAKYLDREERAKNIREAGRFVAESGLSAEDKATFLEEIERYGGIVKANDSNSVLKYAITALVSGGAGFGLGWYARGAYENGKKEEARQIAEMVKGMIK
jgi:hypothetical protein